MLKPLSKGLRVRHNSVSARKVEIVFPAGAEVVVPADVAAELVAASTHFVVVPDLERVDDGRPAKPASKAAKVGR